MALPIQMKYQLQTDRLTLRPHTAADIPALVRLLTDRANTETFWFRIHFGSAGHQPGAKAC